MMQPDLSTYHCAICLLKQNPLNTLDGSTIARIIAQGRPTPALPGLSKECRYKGKAFTRRFKKDNYFRYNWLAGCGVENKLFCWPCYIFSTDPTDTWGYKGFDGLSNFSNSVKTHLNQEVHILNIEKYNTYASDEHKIWAVRLPMPSYIAFRNKIDIPPDIPIEAENHHYTEGMNAENDNDDDGDDIDVIRHSDVMVELVDEEDVPNVECSATIEMASANPAYHCIVCTLTKIPFATLSKDTQQSIVKAGRPDNNMPNLLAKCSINLTAHNWITGCDKNQKLYCWPCLLFNNSEYDTWGKRGFSDFHRLSSAIPEHTKDVSHQAKSKTLNLWIETYSDDSSDTSEEEIQCIPELDFLNSNVSEEEELDIKPNVEALNASSSSSSQQAVKAILDLCDPAGVKEIEIPGSSPIVVRDNSPEPEPISNAHTPATRPASANSAFAEPLSVAESQDYEKANIYRDTDSQTAGSGAEKYQLKWHSHQQNLNSSISYLYKNDRYADVTLITCNSEENFAIPAHKLVLGTSSTYFANIFDKSPVPTNAMMYIVLPPELTKRAIQTLIQYMYTGESTVSVDILNEVLRGGEILKIRGLWRNQAEAPSSSEQPVSKDRQRPERISVDRIPLQEPRVAQNPVTIHDSPVIVTNIAKSQGISQTTQMPASSSTPIINVNKNVAIDPGDRSCRPQIQKRPFQECNQQQQVHRQPLATKTTMAKPSSSSNVESTYTPSSGAQAMPEELNFLNVKEEPVEWTDVNAEEISLDKTDMPMVKVEIKETANVEGNDSQGQDQIYSPLTCELCSETFTVPAEWVRHIESHTDPPHTVSKRRRRIEDDNNADVTAALKCDLCAMYFVTPAEWVRHVQSTHTETELAISNNSSFPRRSSKSTTSDTQHSATSAAQMQEKSCSICKKSFPSYASMVIHKRTHTGERPFYCDICNKGFNVKSNLLRHMRTLHNQQGNQSPASGDSHGSE